MHWVTQWNQRCIKAIIWSKPKHQNKWLKAAPTFMNSFRNTSTSRLETLSSKTFSLKKKQPQTSVLCNKTKGFGLLKADKKRFSLIVPRLITDELMSNISKLKNKLWDFCLSETFCEFVFCLFAEIVQTTTNSNMFLKKNNWNIFQPERLPDLKNTILWGVWLTTPSEKCSIVLKKNLWVDEQDGGGFDPFINLARNKTSFSLRLTCRTRRQRLRMEGEEGEAGRGGEGRPVFIVLPRRNWAFCLRRDLLHHETAKTYWEQKEETPLCLSLHRSPPSSFSRHPFREKLSTFIFSLLYPSSVCKPEEIMVCL